MHDYNQCQGKQRDEDTLCGIKVLCALEEIDGGPCVCVCDSGNILRKMLLCVIKQRRIATTWACHTFFTVFTSQAPLVPPRQEKCDTVGTLIITYQC